MSVGAEKPPRERGDKKPALAFGAVGAVLFAGLVGLLGWWLGGSPDVTSPKDGLAPEAMPLPLPVDREPAVREANRRQDPVSDIAIALENEPVVAPPSAAKDNIVQGPLAAEWAYLDQVLSGQVLRTHGSDVGIGKFIPLPHAVIELRFALGSEWFHSEQIQVDRDARFEFDLAALHPHVGSACNVGELEMEAFVTHAAATGKASAPNLWELLVGNSEDSEFVVWLSERARVLGRIVDDQGRAVDGLGIELFIGDEIHEGETSDRGEFEIETFYLARDPFEEYHRRFPDPPDANAEIWVRSDIHGALTHRFQFDPETPAFDVGTLRLQGDWTLSGDVVSRDGHPLPGVDLRVSHSDGLARVWIRSDDRGRFRFQGKPGREYQFRLGTNSFGTTIAATAPAHGLTVRAPGPTAILETIDIERRPVRGLSVLDLNPCLLNSRGQWEYVTDEPDCLLFVGDTKSTVLFPFTGTYEAAVAWDGIAGVWSVEQLFEVREGHQWIQAAVDFHGGLRLDEYEWKLQTFHPERDR